MSCIGFTYVVFLLRPMEYSLCIKLTATVTIAIAITSIIETCSAQNIKIECITTCGDSPLLTMQLQNAVNS
jgi:hypothetical protein